MTTVLVCGGRDFNDVEFISEHLGDLHRKLNFTLLIHGNAKGADRVAGAWAKVNNIPVKKYPANWIEYGVAAGPIRNRKMLNDGKPDAIVAFPGGRGTANMVKLAKGASVDVIEIDLKPRMKQVTMKL